MEERPFGKRYGVTGQTPSRRRRSLRLPGYDYSQAGAYFITIVTYQRQILLAGPATKNMIEAVWSALPDRFPQIALDAFVIMPNRIHGIILIPDVGAGLPRLAQGEETSPLQRPPLGQIVVYLKYQSAKRINQVRGTPGLPVWQRNYYEHVIRSEAELGLVRQYVWDNPARWDLDPENPAGVSAKSGRGDS